MMEGREKSSEECKITPEKNTRMIKNGLSIKTFPRLGVFFVLIQNLDIMIAQTFVHKIAYRSDFFPDGVKNPTKL